MRTVAKRLIDTYFDHVRSFPLRRIKNVADHAIAKGIYLRLSSGRSDQGTREYLEVLADLIADFEKRANLIVDLSAVSAADIVRHRMQERGISVTALAKEIGIAQPHLSEMLNGRREWSKNAIRAISKAFNIRADRFLN